MSRVAAIQMCTGPDVAANLEAARKLLRAAAGEDARLAVLPENFACMAATDRERLRAAEKAGDGPIQAFLAEQASELDMWIVGGTVPIATARGARVRAAAMVYDDQGAVVARYDKMHLFDVTLSETEQYRESSVIEPGGETVVVPTPVGALGLAVCYDLRFPELFRRLLDAGMTLLALPAAFTVPTGQAHWEVLVRARAIENLCPVIAAAQGGRHPHGRETYGHSMIVSAWGEVLAQRAGGTGVVVADLERSRAEGVRSSFPALDHRRTDLR